MASRLIAIEDGDGVWRIELTHDDDGEPRARYGDDEEENTCCCEECPALDCEVVEPPIACRCERYPNGVPQTVTVTISGATSTCATICEGQVYGKVVFGGTFVLTYVEGASGCLWRKSFTSEPFPFTLTLYSDAGCTTPYSGPAEVSVGDATILVAFASTGAGGGFEGSASMSFGTSWFPCAGPGSASRAVVTGNQPDWTCCEVYELPLDVGGTMTIEPCGDDSGAAPDESEEFFEFVA